MSPIYHDDRVIWDRFWMQRNGSTVCAKNARESLRDEEEGVSLPRPLLRNLLRQCYILQRSNAVGGKLYQWLR